MFISGFAFLSVWAGDLHPSLPAVYLIALHSNGYSLKRSGFKMWELGMCLTRCHQTKVCPPNAHHQAPVQYLAPRGARIHTVQSLCEAGTSLA